MLGWLRKNKEKEYNVCECGERIPADRDVCETCAERTNKLAQAWLCKDNGHIFMIVTFPTRKDMPKDQKFYRAKVCPACLSENIEEQEVRRS